jgi:hypothetical protein
MITSTRRGFVQNSAAAAAGMTVLGALLTSEADARAPHHEGHIVAFVSDARRGEVAVMSGDRTVTIHDRQLAARLVRAIH